MSSSSYSSSAWPVAAARSPREESISNVKEKKNTEEAADEFIPTLGGDLKMQRLKLLADASRSAPAVDELKQKTSSSKIRSSSQHNLSTIPISETTKEVDKSAADFISKFRKELAIERLDSFDRYKQMLDRGV